MPKHATIIAVSKHLHPVRMATYTTRCGGDPYRALQLYRWNVELSGAFQQVLGITEVALRNTIDEQLRAWNAGEPKLPQHGGGNHGPDWLIDPARPLNSMTVDSRRSAKKHAGEAEEHRDPAHPRKGAAVNHDDMLAQITFGVWPKLLPTQDTTDKNFTGRQVLWNQALHKAFPYATADPDGHIIADRARRLHSLRNRVSHMEPLLDVQITARHNDALRLLGTIHPAVRDWCAGLSRVIEIGRQCPISLI